MHLPQGKTCGRFFLSLVDNKIIGMEKPTTLQAAIEALDAANERIKLLEADMDASNQLIDQASAFEATIKQLQSENADLLKEVSELEASNSELFEKAKLNEFKLNEAIARAGVPPVTVVGQSQAQEESKEDLWKQFRSLSVYDRPAFWQKNKHILTR
jgi:predicted RNase H-like nuclease (RuvC/YqgF family)